MFLLLLQLLVLLAFLETPYVLEEVPLVCIATADTCDFPASLFFFFFFLFFSELKYELEWNFPERCTEYSSIELCCAGPDLNDNVVSNQSTLSRASNHTVTFKNPPQICRHYALFAQSTENWHGHSVELSGGWSCGVPGPPLHLAFLFPSLFF